MIWLCRSTTVADRSSEDSLYAVGDDRIGRIARRLPADRLDRAPSVRMVVVRGIDRQEQRVGGRQRAQLSACRACQRAVAGKPPHQLVSRFERRRGQLGLHEPPQHARVVLDEIDGRQQRRPVQLAAEPQLAGNSIPPACRDRSAGTTPARIAPSSGQHGDDRAAARSWSTPRTRSDTRLASRLS